MLRSSPDAESGFLLSFNMDPNAFAKKPIAAAFTKRCFGREYR
jgi:hypothetical protein